MKQRLWFLVLAIWTRHAPRMAAPSHYDDSTPLSALRYHVAGWLATITLFLTLAATARKPRWRSLAKSLRPQTCGTCGHPHYKVFGLDGHALCGEHCRREMHSKLSALVARDLMMQKALAGVRASGVLWSPKPISVTGKSERERIAIDYARAMTGKPHFRTTE